MAYTGYDIKRSAKLATNNYCNYLDEKMNYIPYFYLMTSEDTCGAHCEWDFGDATGRYLDALLLCSEITGKDAGIEQGINRLYKALTEMLHPQNGLCYRPAGYEWAQNAANSFDQRSCILGLATYYKHTQSQETYEMLENLIQGLYRMGIEHEDYFFIPVTDYDEGMERKRFAPRAFDITNYQADQCHYGGGVIIYPLMYWYSLTGSKAALELAGKLSRFIVYHSQVFAQDGSFYILGNGVDSDGHFHSRVDSAVGVMEYAVVTKNQELQGFSKRVYDWSVSQGTRYGLFPEGLGKAIKEGLPEEYPDVSKHSETCCTTDMIELALLLGEHSSTDYYDHAHRYLNHLFASQLDDISWIKPSPDKEDNEICTYRDVATRYKGAYTGRTTANDLTNFGRYDNMGCCVAAGGRGVFLLWSHTARITEETLFVNMLVECDTESITIKKQDFEKITIKAKQPIGTIKIRIPKWLKDDVKATVFEYEDQTSIGAVLIEDGYFVIENYDGRAIVMKAISKEVADLQLFCGEEYQVIWRQNQVIEVMPQGKFMPLYRRE